VAANLLSSVTETSCLVNILHEILVSRWTKKKPCIAVCPSQYLEKYVGFDVALPGFNKILALQFKAYRHQQGKVLDYFSVYGKQHNTLLSYPRNCAFYVFPDYKTHQKMDQDRRQEFQGSSYLILNNTWFVETHSIPKKAKRIYRDHLASGVIPSFTWRKLESELSRCQFGFRIVRIGEYYVLHDPEEREVEVLSIPSGRFSLFYTTI